MYGEMFVCDQCGTVDSITATQQTGPGYRCACCQGQPWHGYFPQRRYNPDDGEYMLNRPPPTERPSFS